MKKCRLIINWGWLLLRHIAFKAANTWLINSGSVFFGCIFFTYLWLSLWIQSHTWSLLLSLGSVLYNVGSEHNMIIYLSDSSLADSFRHCSRWSGELSIEIRCHSLEQYGKQTHKIFQTLSCLTAEREQKCGSMSHSFDVDFKTNIEI